MDAPEKTPDNPKVLLTITISKALLGHRDQKHS